MVLNQLSNRSEKQRSVELTEVLIYSESDLSKPFPCQAEKRLCNPWIRETREKAKVHKIPFGWYLYLLLIIALLCLEIGLSIARRKSLFGGRSIAEESGGSRWASEKFFEILDRGTGLADQKSWRGRRWLERKYWGERVSLRKEEKASLQRRRSWC